MNPILSFLLALLITLAIEVPIGALMLRSKSAVIPLMLINILTNPALNAALTLILSLTRSYPLYWTALAVGELAVFIGEGFLIRSLCNIPLKRSITVSTVINLLSLFLGSAVLALI